MYFFHSLFVDRALKDYERFKKQKVRDLTEVMQNYIKMQIKLCKTVSVFSSTILL